MENFRKTRKYDEKNVFRKKIERIIEMEIRKFRIKIDGKVFEAEVEEIGGEKEQISTVRQPPASTPPKEVTPTQTAPVTNASGNTITAPMPGKVITLKVSKGQKINKGDVILILEAMKMEQEIKSALEGTVSDIMVSEGEIVKKEQSLVVIG